MHREILQVNKTRTPATAAIIQKKLKTCSELIKDCRAGVCMNQDESVDEFQEAQNARP